MGTAIVWLVNTIANLMMLVIIVSAVLSWLFYFDIINHRNRLVNQIAAFTDALSRPLLEPFRRLIPPLGGIDISAIVALLALQFCLIVFNRMAAPALIMLMG